MSGTDLVNAKMMNTALHVLKQNEEEVAESANNKKIMLLALALIKSIKIHQKQNQKLIQQKVPFRESSKKRNFFYKHRFINVFDNNTREMESQL